MAKKRRSLLDKWFAINLLAAGWRARFRLIYFLAFMALALLLQPGVGLWRAIFSPTMLMMLLLAYLPYALARHSAVLYLEDIYELGLLFERRAPKSHRGSRYRTWALGQGLNAAKRFIKEAAFADGYSHNITAKFGFHIHSPSLESLSDVLMILKGNVQNEYTPLLWIGGPGYAYLGADSAALFELADGSWRVVGPTTKQMYLMEGFERLRRIVSLREHTSGFAVSARTRDGIRVTTRDVRVIYRIYSGARRSTPKNPYPFAPQAVRTLVLNERASNEELPMGGIGGSLGLASTLEGIAKGEIRRFIRSQTLVQLLASISPPDPSLLEEVRREMENELAAEASPSKREQGTLPPAVQLFPHQIIAERFNAMVNGPNGELARKRGVGIHWIGVGTFDPPIERIPEHNVEAWRLSVENMMRQNPVALAALKRRRWVGTIFKEVREIVRVFQLAQSQGRKVAAQKLLAPYRAILLRTLDALPPDDELSRELVKFLPLMRELAVRDVDGGPP